MPVAVEAGADEAAVQHVCAVGFSEDILDKAKAQTALPLQAQLNREAVAASEGGLVVDFSAGEDQVVALFVKAGKAERPSENS